MWPQPMSPRQGLIEIVLPTFGGLVVLFALSVTDTLFLTTVDRGLVNVFGIMSLPLVATQVTAQIASTTSANDTLRRLPVGGSTNTYGIVLLASVATVIPYALALALFSRPLLRFGGVEEDLLDAGVLFVRMNALALVPHALFRGLRAVAVALGTARVNLKAGTLVFVVNVSLNFITVTAARGRVDDATVVVLIALGTLVSYAVGGALIWSHLFRNFGFDWRAVTQWPAERLRRAGRYIATTVVSSVEVWTFNGSHTIVVGLLAATQESALLARNGLVPLFLFGTAWAIAWSEYAGRELAFGLAGTSERSAALTLENVSRLAVRCAAAGVVVLIVPAVLLVRYLDLTPLGVVVFVYAALATTEVFRARNLISLAAVRLVDSVNQSALLAIFSHTLLVVLAVGASVLGVLSVPLLFCLIAVDEMARSVVGARIARRVIASHS